jgi:hypothetical protein
MSSGGWWCFIKVAVMEEEVSGRPFDEGEMKGVGRWLSLAPSRCRRVAHGGAWRGGAPEEVAAARAFEGGRRPREGQLGPEAGEAWALPAGWQLGQKAYLG